MVELLAVKLKLFWILFVARNVLTNPWVWLVLATALVVWVAVVKIRGQRRMRRLARKDPQLLALYARLKTDKKAGRL